MNIMTRQILSALGVAVVISVLLPAFVFFIFPLDDWRQLWNRRGHESPIHYFFTKYSIRGRFTIWNSFRYVLESEV